MAYRCRCKPLLAAQRRLVWPQSSEAVRQSLPGPALPLLADQQRMQRLLPIYKPKQREGVVERVEADGCTAVCRRAGRGLEARDCPGGALSNAQGAAGSRFTHLPPLIAHLSPAGVCSKRRRIWHALQVGCRSTVPMYGHC